MNQNTIHVLARAVLIDQGHILVCKTLDLPANFYFLPGGHIEPGESASMALLRVPQLESHIELLWLPLAQLADIDFRAEPLRKIIFEWLENPLNSAFASVML